MSALTSDDLKQSRRKWSQKLGDAEYWIAQSRIHAKAGDYKKSRDDVLMACAILDDACQHQTEAV